MTKLNVFIENIYPEKIIEDKNFLTGTKKILKYFLQNEKIIRNSCLNNCVYKTICFDIVLCDNKKIHEINLNYRDKDKPTDVITFALFADSPVNERFIFDGEINLGEIFISLDKTSEQAKEKNHSFKKELFFLVSHGIMHLLGFEHSTEEALNFMLEEQEKSMENINVKIHT